MKGYESKITFSSKELTAKERIYVKDTTAAISLDTATQEGEVVIDVDMYATIQIHNENSENADYEKYVIIAKSGEKYVTGSESFYETFVDIMNEMKDETEPFSIVAYRMPSKNYKGKEFITCSIR